MREVRDAVELGDYEFVEQRIDSPRMKQWLLTDTCSRRYRHMLSAREQGPLSTLDAMEFPDRRGTAMADEP